MSTNKAGTVLSFVVSGVFIVVAIWAVLNRQLIFDQFSVWNYTPSAAIIEIEEKAAFTDDGQFIFYATHPVVAEQSEFNEECPRQEVGNPILGCYTSSDRIYIYELTNDQLAGMKEVTAVHEMLHAVWVRMGESERKEVDTLLRDAYASIEDSELKDRMAYYERTEPGQFTNELHSILGTEVHDLSPALEQYYAKYFDRETILALHDAYSAVYDSLYAQADDLYQKMEALAQSIETRSTQYDADVAQLSSDIDSFNARANSGNFASVSQFNAERASLIARRNALEAERIALNNDIALYNEYYAQYQELAKQIEVLNDSIDSFQDLESVPSV